MSKRVITEEEFVEWLQHPATKAFKKALFKDREVIKENLVQGVYENPEQARGMAKAIQSILILDYESLMVSLTESVV